MKNYTILLGLLFSLLAGQNSFSQIASTQANIINNYPKNHSMFVPLGQTLIFKTDGSFYSKHFSNIYCVVKGSKSGINSGSTKIVEKGKTLLYFPEKKFKTNETVLVSVFLNRKYGEPILSYSFTTTSKDKAFSFNNELPNSDIEQLNKMGKVLGSKTIRAKSDLNLPDDFPQYYISENSNPGVGNYFINAAVRDTISPEYNMIIDTTGFPLFFQRFPVTHRENFFTYHPSVDLITYFDEHDCKFVGLNNSLEKVDTYEAINYCTDGHELILNEDGSFWLIATDPEPVDMSQIYPGGCANAIVKGNIIQEIDADNNLLFQWSTWDHFNILDADTNFVDFTRCAIDYAHVNSLSLDSLGNLLISSRHMSEITKVDIQTGDIIWRMGGNNNQFTFTNDSVQFKGQHNIIYLGNQQYSMFDNGNSRTPPYSRAITYILDETNLTATLTEDYQKHDPADFTPFMGSNQTLDNGSHLVGWAANFQKNVFTQFNSDGDVEFEIQSVDTFGVLSYRAFKYPWETSLFNFDADTLDFGYNVLVGDSVFTSTCLTNNSEDIFTINGYYCTDSTITLTSPLPITIDANSCDTLTFCFKPIDELPVSAVFSAYYQNDSIRIANQIRMLGGGIIDNINTHSMPTSSLSIVPNPCSQSCRVSFNNHLPMQQLDIYTIEGRLVKSITVNNMKSVILSNMEHGIYIIKIGGREQRATGKLVVD